MGLTAYTAAKSAKPKQVLLPRRGRLQRNAVQPRLRAQVILLEGVDQVALGQREADIVQAVEQAVLAELVNLERERLAVGCAQCVSGPAAHMRAGRRSATHLG